MANDEINMKMNLDAKDVLAMLGKITTAMNRLNTQMTKLNKTASKQSTMLNKMQSGMRKGTNTVNQKTAAYGKLGGQLKSTMMQYIGLQAVIAGVVHAGREMVQWVQDSITEFRTFEQNIAEVSTILQGDLMDLLPSLKSGIEQLSVSFGKSANDLSRGMYDILSAAISAEDSLRLLTTATKASIAGLTDVSTSVDVFTSILNSYGMTVAQAANVSDVLFQTVVRGKLRFEDLASAMGYITPIAANAGVAFEEIAAALATVTRQGLHVDMATRGLALMIQGIVSPANAAADAAAEFGVEMNGLALRVKGLKGFIDELNEAAEEHGMTILPQIVRNMRSLRVAMALAGEEGVKGFTQDLDLMAHATGKTEEALTKMMNAQQRHAEILAQSLEYVERRIGESWSSVDIWWKKTQLWWGTLLSGGDARDAVTTFDLAVQDMEDSYFEMITNTARISKKDPFSSLLKNSEDVKNTVLNESDLAGVRQYIQLSSDLENVSEAWSNITDMQERAKRVTEVLSPEGVRMDDTRWTRGYTENVQLTEKEIAALNTTIEAFNETAGLDPSLKLGVLEYGATFKDVHDILDQVKGMPEEFETEIESLNQKLSASQVYIDYFVEGFDTLGQSIAEHKQNILELENAITDLEEEVEKVYTTMNGEGRFHGRLEWELAVKYDETMLDRFEQHVEMATKYGTDYMDDYIDQYGELDAEMSNAINTIYEYNQAVEAQEEAEKELQKTLDENLKLIRLNNLEKMKLQLKGMMRRRGNTRAEMKMMHKLDMDNLRLRIENMGKEIEAEEEAGEDITDSREAAYEEAKKYLDEYLDVERFNLWQLKDVRNDDIQNLEDTISQKRNTLEKYRIWRGEELLALKNESAIYIEAMQTLADEAPDIYEKLFDTDAIENFIDKYNEFSSMITGEKPENLERNENLASGITQLMNMEQRLTSMLDVMPENAPMRRSIERQLSTIQASRQQLTGQLTSGVLGSYPRGTQYIGSEGLYHLHRGEQVVASNSVRNESAITINVNVTGNTIATENTNRIANEIADQVQRRLIDAKTGKTKYRMR